MLHRIDHLRKSQRKLVRELGLLGLNQLTKHETPSYWHALIEIGNHEGITILELGEILLLTPSTISRLIKTITKEGKVEISPLNDKRQKGLYLTPAGKEALKKIDLFSEEKIKGAFEFLSEEGIQKVLEGINLYAEALEKNRHKKQVKILTLSTSRPLRHKIVKMIETIQKGEFNIPITPDINESVLKAEDHFYYNHSYNFWYAVDKEDKVIGSIGLKKWNDSFGEIKKMFVIPEYRSQGLAKTLLKTCLKSASKHGFEKIILGSEGSLKAAHRFYEKMGFKNISRQDLPDFFEVCPLDSQFYIGSVAELSTYH